MRPSDFPESNTIYGPPAGMSEEHCESIPAFVGEVKDGPFDGCRAVVVAWKPDEEDLRKLAEGGLVFLTILGTLPPHFLTTDQSVLRFYT